MLVAKWIAGNGISPGMLCLVQDEDAQEGDSLNVEEGQEVSEEKKSEPEQNPIVGKNSTLRKIICILHA